MSNYSTNEIRGGMKLLIDGDPYAVIENEYVKPGKGQAFNRIRVRNLRTGRTVEKSYRSGESIEAADVMDSEMQYLYKDGDFWTFMNPENYEQLQAGEAAVGDAAKWLKDGVVCIITLWNGVPLVVTPPPHIELKVIETDPGLRGDTATGGQKPAKLETGAVVRVPLFINEGEVLRIDTRTVLPKRVDKYLRQRFQAARVGGYEARVLRAVEIEHSQQLVAADQRNHDLGVRSRITGDVAGKRVYVFDQHCLALRSGRAAHALAHGNAHARGLALERAQHQLATLI